MLVYAKVAGRRSLSSPRSSTPGSTSNAKDCSPAHSRPADRRPVQPDHHHPFPYAEDWHGVVATLEHTLRLHNHQPGTLVRLDRYLHQRTGGMIGSLSHLIRGAAIEAILDHSEKNHPPILDGIDLDHAAEQNNIHTASTSRRGQRKSSGS
jgi:hypothetical protein